MTEPNPYEPSQSPEPLQPVQVAKRGIGLLVIVLLTPVAVLITGGISCRAAPAFFKENQNTPWSAERSLAIFLIPPVVVLVVMLGWAVVRAIGPGKTAAADQRQSDGNSQTS